MAAERGSKCDTPPPPRNAVMPAPLAEMSKWPRCQRTDGPATLKSQLPRTLRSRRPRDPESLPLPREGWRREGNGRDKVADATATTRRRSTRKQLPRPPLRGRRADRIASSGSPEKDSPRLPLPLRTPLTRIIGSSLFSRIFSSPGESIEIRRAVRAFATSRSRLARCLCSAE